MNIALEVVHDLEMFGLEKIGIAVAGNTGCGCGLGRGGSGASYDQEGQTTESKKEEPHLRSPSLPKRVARLIRYINATAPSTISIGTVER